MKNSLLNTSFRDVEFTAVSLLPAVAADIDITVFSEPLVVFNWLCVVLFTDIFSLIILFYQ